MKLCCEKWKDWQWSKEESAGFRFCPWCGASKDEFKFSNIHVKTKKKYEFLKPTEEERRAGMVATPGRSINMAMHEARALSPRPYAGANKTAHQLWLIACRKAGYDYIGVPVGGYARKIGVAP